MDGILGDLPWTSERLSSYPPRLEVLKTPPTFMYSKGRREFHWTEYGSIIWYHCDTIDKLASFMQSSLFFGLLAAFLDEDINPDDYTTNGLIDLNTPVADQAFRNWRTKISTLLYSAQQQAHEVISSLIEFARRNCEIFEEATDRFESKQIFDLVALSVRLLLSLLTEVTDDTFALIRPRLGGPWNTFTSAVLAKLDNRKTTIPSLVIFKTKGWDDTLLNMDDEQRKWHLHGQLDYHPPFPSGVDGGGRAAKLLHGMFVSNGWCPYRALQLCRSYDYSILNALAALKRHPPAPESHDSCTESQRCVAHNIVLDQPNQYPFEHHNHAPDSDCDFVDVPINEVVDIIDSGSIPLISVSRQGALDLQVTGWSPYVAYTAISHVWSDGMGNPQSNSLPRCVLRRIRELVCHSYDAKENPFYDEKSRDILTAIRVSSSSHPTPYGKLDKKRIYFWMDTLCIPVPSRSRSTQRNNELKVMAMKHITPIFSGALNTLVLEKGLQETTFPEPSLVSADEFAAQILSSKWMQRGWTLEEGSLSMHTVFQMSRKPFPMLMALVHNLPVAEHGQSPLVRANIKIRKKLALLLRRSLLEEKQELTNTWPGHANTLVKQYRAQQFAWAWNSLVERSTTREADGILILTNMLDFNVSDIKNKPSNERLKVLIQSCEELPLSLLYHSCADPASLLSPRELGWMPSRITGNRLTVGAVLRRAGRRSYCEKAFYRVDLSECDRRSFLVLHTSAASLPSTGQLFAVKFRRVPNQTREDQYIIQLHGQSRDEEETRRNPPSIENILIDLTSGTTSKLGLAGRGVCLRAQFYEKNRTTCTYGNPLTVWTPEQALYRFGPSVNMLVVQVGHAPSSQKLYLQFDASQWCKPLFRRPTLSLRTPLSMIVAGTLLFLSYFPAMYIFAKIFHAVREALGIEPFILPLGAMAIWSSTPILLFMIFLPVQRKVAIFAYLKWLQSFEDEDERRRRRNTPSKFRAFFIRFRARLMSRGVRSEYTGGGEIQL